MVGGRQADGPNGDVSEVYSLKMHRLEYRQFFGITSSYHMANVRAGCLDQCTAAASANVCILYVSLKTAASSPTEIPENYHLLGLLVVLPTAEA